VQSDRQQALSVLESDYRELKALRSFSASGGRNQQQALKLGQQMVAIATALYDSDPTPQRRKDLEFARYYEAVSGCLVAQLSADFEGAWEYAAAAGQSAKHFRGSRRFFPNFFFDEAEIASHDVYLEAVRSFRQGSFREAADHFEKWLTLNSHRQGKGDVHYDSNQFHHELCSVLDAIHQGSDCAAQWAALDQALQSANLNIYRTTRALWDRLEPLMAVAKLGEERFPRGHSTIINSLLQTARDEWRLLCTSAPLRGKDREAGLEESVRLPGFIDVFHCLQQAGALWQYLLLQSFRNALVLKADYESRLRAVAPVDMQRPDVATKASFEIERLQDATLLSYIRSLIASRSDTDLRVYDPSAPLWWEAQEAIFTGNRNDAEEKCRRFYSKLRSFPHVLRITSCQLIASTAKGIGSSGTFYRLATQRIWHYSSNELTIRRCQQIMFTSAIGPDNIVGWTTTNRALPRSSRRFVA